MFFYWFHWPPGSENTKTRIPIRNAGFHKSGGDLISTFKVAHPTQCSVEGTLALPARLPGSAACRTVPDDVKNLFETLRTINTVLCHKKQSHLVTSTDEPLGSATNSKSKKIVCGKIMSKGGTKEGGTAGSLRYPSSVLGCGA